MKNGKLKAGEMFVNDYDTEGSKLRIRLEKSNNNWRGLYSHFIIILGIERHTRLPLSRSTNAGECVCWNKKRILENDNCPVRRKNEKARAEY